MYVVYDPNHQVKVVDDLPKIALIMQIWSEVLDGEREDDITWNDECVQVFTSKGVYTIQHVELGKWIQ